MGQMKELYWLTTWGQDIAHQSHDRISHCLADFVSSVMSHKGIIESNKLKDDVIREMVEAREDFQDYHYDTWH